MTTTGLPATKAETDRYLVVSIDSHCGPTPSQLREYGLDVAKLQSVADTIGPTIDDLDQPLDHLPGGNLGWAFREVGKWA